MIFVHLHDNATWSQSTIGFQSTKRFSTTSLDVIFADMKPKAKQYKAILSEKTVDDERWLYIMTCGITVRRNGASGESMLVP